MRIGNIAGLIDGSMSTIYDSGVLTSAQTSITISGLDGDTDEIYQLIIFGNTGASNNRCSLQFNGDTGANYGAQKITGYSTSKTSARLTSQTKMEIGTQDSALNELEFEIVDINALTGTNRTATSKGITGTTGTTVYMMNSQGFVWNNSDDNITSMTISSKVTNGFGADSRIVLLKKAQGGMRTGNLEPIGGLEYQWEKIFQSNINSYLTSPDSGDWDIFASATENWTIDCRIKLNVANTVGLIGQYEDVNNRWSINLQSNGILFYLRSGGTWVIASTPTGTGLTPGQWYHIAVCKVGSTFGVYIDGVQLAYVSSTSTDSFTSPLYIGQEGASSFFNGGMDELRIEKSNVFSATPVVGKTDTITVPTTIHTATANTKLLLHGEDFTDSSEIQRYDTSEEYNDVIFKGSMSTSATQKKWGSKSFYFDGTSDYMIMPDSASWEFANSSITKTFDCWVYSTSFAVAQNIYSHSKTGGTIYTQCTINTAGKVSWTMFDVSGGNLINLANTTALSINTWHHIALVTVGTSYAIYIDGVQKHWNSSSLSILPTADFAIGCQYQTDTEVSNYIFNGYIDEVRVYNGNPFSASPNSGMTDTITVPTSAHTVDTNTKLLMDAEDNTLGHPIDNYFVTSDVLGGYFDKGLVFGGASTSEVVISGLDGDNDGLYMLSYIGVDNGSGVGQHMLRLNGDSSANYGYQQLVGVNTVVQAGRSTIQDKFEIGYTNASYPTTFSQTLLYSASGNERPCITTSAKLMGGTTASYMNLFGQSWNNTSSNITSMTVAAQSNSFKQGTSISLYRLKLTN